MRYSDLTTNAPNPLKRYVHRRRLCDAMLVLDGLDVPNRCKILDVGGGDGDLCKRITERFPRAEIFCYEPTPEIFREATQNLKYCENVKLVPHLEGLRALRFDRIFSLEVLEHLPTQQLTETINAMDSLLADGGILTIGVPHELFFPALFKGLFRMSRRFGEYDTRFSNVIRAVIGKPPTERPMGEITQGLPYHFHHMGFDYRKLRNILEDRFNIVYSFGSPIKWLGTVVNSEVYFVMMKKPKECR